MLQGVYAAVKKDGTTYYRSNITYMNKHISLGSFETEILANAAYLEAMHLLRDSDCSIEHAIFHNKLLNLEKTVILVNFRDNGVYIKTPIYLRKNFFSYYINKSLVLKFDIDDLFYYSSHKIIKRGGHYFVNDYGMQYNIVDRYGIKNHSVIGKDYEFVNGDITDYRYSNIRIINAFHGVSLLEDTVRTFYQAKIHINGYYYLGKYESPELAAIAYNKGVDLAKSAGINKNFPTNYIEYLSASAYADLYTKIKLPQKYVSYLAEFSS